MASHALSIILKAVGATQAAKDIGKVDSATGRLQQTAKEGLRAGLRNTAIIGGGVAAGIVIGVKQGLGSLATLESAVTSVNGAIETAGIRLSGEQIAGWANEIEASVQSAFDDKDITAATATLIRFGKVTPQNIRPAMEVMTDLAAKTGSVDSAAQLLAKALAKPTDAAGKLSRAGVVLTQTQIDTVAALQKEHGVAAAQQYLLEELATSTAGAAAAMNGEYNDSLLTLQDTTEDAQRALAEGFMPVIMEVRDLLTGALANPETLDNIREFGDTLAGGLSSLIDIAKNLPWQTIGDSLRIAGTGARAVLDAFAGLPSWVQTAVITGWGLNKLTGGALGGIVGELSKGLIKGVLGITAGVVHVNGPVAGVGGVPGPVSGGGSLLKSAAKGAGALGIGLIVGEIIKEASGMTDAELEQRQAERFKGQYGGDAIERTTRAVEGVQREQENTTSATSSGLGGIASLTGSGFASVVAAVRSIPAPVIINNVSATTVTQSQTTHDRNGRTPSRVRDAYNGAR